MLARERAIRNRWGDSFKSHTIKYELGDVTAELRMVGNQSFIRLETGGALVAREWVAYPAQYDLRCSAVNQVGTYNGPQATQRPVFPPMEPTPDPPNIPRPNPADFKQDSFDPVSGVSFKFTAMQAIKAGQIAARGPLIRQYYTITAPPNLSQAAQEQLERTIETAIANSGGDYWGVTSGGFDPSDGSGANASYSPSDDYKVAFLQWEIDSFVAHRAWAEDAENRRRAYEAAYAQWADTVLREWNEKNLPSLVCPPYYAELMDKRRQGRAGQLAALYAEAAQGIGALSVFGGVMRPIYIPKEEPAEPFSNGAGGLWEGPGAYSVGIQSAVPVIAPSPVQVCDSTAPATRYSNFYVGDKSEPPAITTARAYGYRIDGDVFNLDVATPSARATLSPGYEDWIDSPRRDAQGIVSFDLFYGPAVGEVYIAQFEFYSYDYGTDQWLWTPTEHLFDTEPVRSCYSICYAYPDHERDAQYTNRPDIAASTTAMRSLGFFKHTRQPDGSWSGPVPISAAPISLDLTGSGMNRGSLPPMVVVAKGVQEWMTPAFPNPATAVDKAFMGTQSVPTSPFASQSTTDAYLWLLAQCLNRFNIPFQ